MLKVYSINLILHPQFVKSFKVWLAAFSSCTTTVFAKSKLIKRRSLWKKQIFISLLFLSFALSCRKIKEPLEPDDSSPSSNFKVYVTNSGSKSISVIDGSRLTVIKTVEVAANPTIIAACPVKPLIVVGQHSISSISVISTVSDSLIYTMPLPWEPVDVVLDYDSKAYVILDPDKSVFSDQYIASIDIVTNTFTDSLFFSETTNSLSSLAISPSGILYGACLVWPTADYFQAPTPLILDTTTGQRIKFNTFSNSIVKLFPDANYAYLGFGEHDDNLSIFDLQTFQVIKLVRLNHNDGPIAVSLSPTTERMYIANNYSKSISVLEAGTYVLNSIITLSSAPFEIAISPDGQYIFATLPESDKVAVIDSKDNRVVKEILVGSNPLEIIAINSQ